MATVEQLQAKLDALEDAAASGVLSVQHGDTRLVYRSMDELLVAIRRLKARINQANGEARKPVYVRQDDRGY